MAENVSITIRAFDKTAKGFKAAGAGLASLTSSVFSLKTALLATAGAGGFAYMVKASLNATDALSKTASKIGTTTEALGALRYAADITGVATNTLDMALQRFTRRTAEAAKGTGEAKGAIKELGIDAQKLNKMPLDERMLVLADAFSNVQNESDKLRLAFKLFDSEGAALVNTLSLGREGLKELLGEARILGLTMSSSAARGVEETNDSIQKLLSLGKGLRDQFSAALAPAIKVVTERLTRFFLEISEKKGGIEQFAKSMAVSFLNATVSVVSGFQKILNGVSVLLNKGKSMLFSFDKKATESSINYAKQKIKELGDKITVAQAKNQRQRSTVWAEEISTLYEQIAKEEKMLAEMQQNFPTLDLGSIIDIDGYKQTIEGLIQAINTTQQAASGNKDLADSVGSVRQAYLDWKDVIPSTSEMIGSLTTQAINGMTDALTAGITGAANFADAIKSMAKSVVDSLIKMLIQKYIVDAAFGFITQTFAGFGQSATNIEGNSAFIGPMPPKAIGGSVQRGQPYMVGERGMEMFIPNQSGSIVSNDKLNSGGGVVVNQTINVTTGVQQTVRAEIATLMPQIASAAKNAVADARMRGGNYSKMLVGA